MEKQVEKPAAEKPAAEKPVDKPADVPAEKQVSPTKPESKLESSPA